MTTATETDEPDRRERISGRNELVVAGIYEAYHDAIPETVKQLNLPQRPENVLLFGPTGTGKTWAAVALMRAWSKEFDRFGRRECRYHEWDLRFIKSAEILMLLRESYGPRATSTESEVIRKFQGIGLLVIDDLGAERVSDWSLSSLYLILDHRMQRRKPTILSTNMDLKQLDQMDSRIASRLGGMHLVKLKGQDLRLKAGRMP